MRFVMFAMLLAGCCDAGPSFVGDNDLSVPDLSRDQLPACPAGAEASNGARCSYGNDTQCRSPFGYACQCLCTGYWECDLVKVVCDPDGGIPHD